ncbi:MAG TPA: prolipoprotein diacylglyceryl transferase family protein [Polyangiaceae bacterium]
MLPTWTLWQLAACAAASVAFVPASGPRERIAFAFALPFLPLGALGFDWAFALAGWAARGGHGAAPLFGGVVAYGALFGFVLAFVVGTKVVRTSTTAALERVALPLALLVALGRVGCFFAGCEEGIPTSLPWGVLGEHGVRVHPVALYEVASALLAGAVATRARRKFLVACAVYAELRLVIDGFRVHAGVFSPGQWTSLFVLGLVASALAPRPRLAEN